MIELNEIIHIEECDTGWKNIKVSSDFSIHLQLFAKADDEGRTEEATEFKKRKAREDEGRVVKSQELISAVVLLASFLGIWFLGGYLFKSFKNLFTSTYADISTFKLSMGSVRSGLLGLFLTITKIAGPIFAIALFFAIGSNVAQFGFLFTTKTLKFDPSKIMPKFSKIIGSNAKQNLVKSIGKVVIIGIIAFLIISSKFHVLISMIHMQPKDALSIILNAAFTIVMYTCLALMVFSILDFIWQKKEYTEQMKMTKHEVKEERKMHEGDPNVGMRLREKHRDMLRVQVLEKVEEADVIIRNPDHYAIALKWNPETDPYPYILAKGINRWALKIIEIAEEKDVYIHRDEYLAQTFYNKFDEGEPIPPEFLMALVPIYKLLYQRRGIPDSLKRDMNSA